jgi:hypothetical protein
MSPAVLADFVFTVAACTALIAGGAAAICWLPKNDAEVLYLASFFLRK